MSVSVRGNARVVRGTEGRVASAAGYPPVVFKDHAEMGCGCKVLVGIRLDNGEQALIASNCEEDGHFEAMVEFNERFAATLAAPEDRETVLVVCDVLSATFTDLEAG